MDVLTILSDSLWTALFATCLAVVLTAPPQFLLATFVCGFIGRVVRDLSVEIGMNINWATALAAALLFLAAAALTRRQAVSPAVLVCAVLPLGAAIAMFDLIFALVQVSTATGAALTEASVALSANVGKVFATSLSIAVGLAAGMTVVAVLKRQEPVAQV